MEKIKLNKKQLTVIAISFVLTLISVAIVQRERIPLLNSFAQATGEYWNIERDENDNNKLKFYFLEDKANPPLVLSRDGFVGMGTNQPEAKFHLADGHMLMDNHRYMTWKDSAGGVNAYVYYDFDNRLILMNSHGGGSLNFYAGGGSDGFERMTITSSGDVGIGTDAPSLVNGSSNKLVHLYGSFNPGLAITNSTASRQWLTYVSDSGHYNVFDATSNKVITTIDTGGNVGIGTTNPGGDKLDVRGRAYASGGWQSDDADYAEWFEKEETTKHGDLVGINMTSGKVRKYRKGDHFVGIHSANPAVVGNRIEESDEEMEERYTLVGLLGQLDFDTSQTKIHGRVVKTIDGKTVGVLLSNNKVLIGN